MSPSEIHSQSSSARQSLAGIDLLVDVLAQADEDSISEGFYSRLAEAVCSFADMRRAVIFRYDDARRRVHAAGACGVDLSRFNNAHFTVEAAPAARDALAEDRVIEIGPEGTHVTIPGFTDLVTDRWLVYVPIAAAGRWIGVIVAEPQADAMRLDDGRRSLLWTLGKTLALATTSRVATFYGERSRQLEERINLARDIHDRVVQRLFGVSMALSVEQPLDDATRIRCGEEVQAALLELRAALQRPLGRRSPQTNIALADELERLQALHPDLGLTVEGPVENVPDGLEPLVQSVLTEAVRNARKHAEAERVTVRARRHGGAFVLEIENDGVGHAPRLGPAGVGLRLAALEALQVGGVVEFGRRSSGNWQVRLVLPEAQPAPPV